MTIDTNKIFQSKKFKRLIGGLIALIVILFIFRVGVEVGFRKANFSYKWGENYHRNFGGPARGFLGNLGQKMTGRESREFLPSYGVFGQIIKIELPTITIKGSDNTEKIVLLKNETVINRYRETIKSSDLRVDDNIVVIGAPNDTGQIEAKLIRVMPASSAGGPASGGQFSAMPMQGMRLR